MNSGRFSKLASVIAIAAAPLALADEPAFVMTRVLTASTANRVAVAVEQACKKRGYQIAVAVTDRYGNLLAFLRDPLAGAHTITVAQDKAYTAATLQGATLDLMDRVAFLRDTPRMALIGGGVPITAGGYLYGAVGVSGAPATKKPGDMDDTCAREGIKTIHEALEFAG